jgi:hypothetical protein
MRKSLGKNQKTIGKYSFCATIVKVLTFSLAREIGDLELGRDAA